MNTIIAWVLIGVAPVHGGTVYTATKFDTKSQCEQVAAAHERSIQSALVSCRAER